MNKIYNLLSLNSSNTPKTNMVSGKKNKKTIGISSFMLFAFAMMISNIALSQFTVPFSGNNTLPCGQNTLLQDHAGAGNYSNNANGFTVLQNGGAGQIAISGSYPYIEGGWDYLRIFDGVGTGGALLYTYSNSGGGTITSFTGTPGQILTVQFTTDASVTGAGFDMNVNYLGMPTVTVTPTTPSICMGQTITLTAATTATTFAWSNAAITATTDVSPSMDAAYSVTVTENGCIGSSMVTVTVNALPTVSVTSGAICAGESFTMMPSGASTYTYSSGSAVVSPTVNANYNVVGTSSLGCVSSNTAVSTVTVNALPTVTTSASSSAICIGSTVTLTAVSSVGSYTWNTGATTSITPTPTMTTVYTASATSVAGCIGSSMITVTVNAIPTISVTSGAICSGKSFTVVASGATTYTYSGGSAVVTPTANASYTVSGNAAGCVGTSSAVSTVTVNTSPTISASASNSVICAGEAITLSATASSTSYTWNTGATTASVSVSPTTTTNYTVTTTATNGCTKSANVNVTVNACTGINEVTASLISVYPNPNNGIVNITLTAALAQNSTLEIYDALGKLVVKQVLANELNAVNMSNLDNGIYVFKVINNNNTVKIGKLIKQ